MKINVSWLGSNPINLTEPHHAAALLRILYDVMGSVEPLTDFQFELAGILCIAEYEVTEPGEFVCVRLGFAAPGCPMMGQSYITEDGRTGVHFEIEEDDFNQVLLDSETISWRT
jgi:hypothetical protein